MQGTDKLNTITKIVFVLTDVLETNLLEMQQQYKKEGFELRHDSKPSFLYCCCISRRLVSKTSVRTNTMLVIVFSLSVPCIIVYSYF